MQANSQPVPNRRGFVPRLIIALVAVLLCAAAAPSGAQQPPPVPAGPQSRADLEARATRLEQEVSSASTDEERASKAAEAAMIRTRLRDGDFSSGDRIVVKVDTNTSGVGTPDTLVVRGDQMVDVPGLPAISLAGVLHSELSHYLTEQFSRYFRSPKIEAIPMLRVAVLGPVGNPGFYAFPADVLLSDAIMNAGGPAATAKLDQTVVKRGDIEVVDRRAVQRALVYGYTLSQMNVRDGDAIYVGGANPRNWTNALRAVSIGLGLAVTIYGISRNW